MDPCRGWSKGPEAKASPKSWTTKSWTKRNQAQRGNSFGGKKIGSESEKKATKVQGYRSRGPDPGKCPATLFVTWPKRCSIDPSLQGSWARLDGD